MFDNFLWIMVSSPHPHKDNRASEMLIVRGNQKEMAAFFRDRILNSIDNIIIVFTSTWALTRL